MSTGRSFACENRWLLLASGLPADKQLIAVIFALSYPSQQLNQSMKGNTQNFSPCTHDLDGRCWLGKRTAHCVHKL